MKPLDLTKEYNPLTEGSILRSLLLLSGPVIIANILHSAYHLTDTFWLGRLGAEAVAAVSLSFPIIFLIVSAGVGIPVAGTILVAQHKGRNDRESVDHITTQTILMVLIISALASLCGYFLTPLTVSLMGAEEAVAEAAISYMRISFIGMIFLFLFMVFQSLMRGAGNVKLPMLLVLSSVILNLILDPLFIFGFGRIPAYGVTGAALATLGTQGLAGIIGLLILIRGKSSIHFNLADMKPDWKLLKQMISIGIPASLDRSTRALGMTFMTFLVATFGTVTLAAYGIGGRVLSLVIIPSFGLSMATETLVGQNIGAGKIERAEKITHISSITGFIFLTIAGVLSFVFADPLARLFIPGDYSSIASSAEFIRYMSLSFGFIGLHMGYSGAFSGAGNTMASMVLSIISLWILRFPLSYLFSMHTPLRERGIWLAFPIANVIAALVALLWFIKGTWKDKDLLGEKKLKEETIREARIEDEI